MPCDEEHKERAITRYRKSLVVFAGLPLTGKTTVAKRLTEDSNYSLLDVDEVRRQEDPVVKVLEQREERRAVEQTYIRIFELAKNLIENERPVIIAGVFSRPDPYHNQLKTFVDELNVPLRFFYLEPPSADEIERRIHVRLNSSDNRSNVTSYDRFAEVEARYQLIEGVNVVRIDSQLKIEDMVEIVKKELKDLVS